MSDAPIMGIYRIDGPGDCVYIGSSVDIKHRWGEHRRSLSLGKHHSRHLQHAWNKHGPDAFTFSVVEEVGDKSNLRRIEQIWLDILFVSLDSKQIYNICTNAYEPPDWNGKQHSDKTKQKLRDIALTRRHDSATKDQIASSMSNGTVYTIITPDGTVCSGIVNVTAFARAHGLYPINLLRILKKQGTHHKGYTGYIEA